MSHSDTHARALRTCSPAAEAVWLSRHVHVCKLGSSFIVLNVARDEYLGVAGSAAQCLSAWLRGWPQLEPPDEVTPAPVSPDEASKVMADLIAQGVLTKREADARKTALPWREPSTASRALDHNNPSSLRIRCSDIIVFLTSLASTAAALRFRSLQSALDSLETRKARQGRYQEFNVERTSDLIAIFRRLRSFTFSGHRRCLFHALALMKFLSHYGIHPNFVMGVKVEPWAAHSWVEYGDYVLDATPEQVRFYHPILIV
jgi:hypothetical protein